MSFWDAAIYIGLSVVGDIIGGATGGGGGQTQAKEAPRLDNTKFMTPLKGSSGLSPTQRRSMDETARAQTVREKGAGLGEGESEEGADAIALALMWTAVLDDEAE